MGLQAHPNLGGHVQLAPLKVEAVKPLREPCADMTHDSLDAALVERVPWPGSALFEEES